MRDFLESEVGGFLIFVIIGTMFALALFRGVNYAYDLGQIARCEHASVLSSLPTYYDKKDQICWIELQPDLVVRVQDIEKYSHFLER
jgi:hypothetical protein